MHKSSVELGLTSLLVNGEAMALGDILGEKLCGYLTRKFAHVAPPVLAVATAETVKFLYLSAYAPDSLFFAGDGLIDDIWHALVIETAEYRAFCHRLRPNCFIDHSGMPYDEYSSYKPAETLHEEQLSWLVNYVATFGPITPEGFEHLLMAQAMAARLDVDLEGLNRMASLLIDEHQKQRALGQKNLSLDHFLEHEVWPNAVTADHDALFVRNSILEIMRLNAEETEGELNLLSPDKLEKVFSASVAVGFTLWQHLAAVERLSSAPEFTQSHERLWHDIRAGRTLVGLGTTHLGSYGGAKVEIVNQDPDAIFVSGQLPWVSGQHLFSHVVIGFESTLERYFALIEFPRVATASTEVSIDPHHLHTLNATDSVRISLKNFRISNSQIINHYHKNSPPKPRTSRYDHPELGIVTRVLVEIQKLDHKAKPEKFLSIDRRAGELANELKKLRTECAQTNPTLATGAVAHDNDLLRQKDALIQKAVRLFIFAHGAASLKQNSLPAVLHMQSLLFDVLIQPTAVLSEKILSI